MKKIAFAGGGTGGHIFPIKSLIEYFAVKNPEIELFWFGEPDSMEEKICKGLKKSGIKVEFLPIKSGKVRRYMTLKAIWQNFVDIFKLKWGYFQSLRLIRKHKIDVIFSKGGYVSLPPSIAARTLRKTVYMHESDTVPGLANRVVGKFANKIFLGLETRKHYFPEKKTQLIGQILGDIFYSNGNGAGNRNSDSSLGINDEGKGNGKGNGKLKIEPRSKGRGKNGKFETTNLLVIGGSQGASTILEALLDISREDFNLVDKYNITIIGGTLNLHYKEKFKYLENVNFLEFVTQEEMADILASTDISITRGGATSLAEQHIFGIKKIIIPLPFTGGNHQYRNAMNYTEKGDIMLEQKDGLVEELKKVMEENVEFKKEVKKKDLVDSKAFIYSVVTSD